MTLSIAFQALQSVSRQYRERSEIRRSIEDVQFPESLALNGLKPANGFSMEEALGISASEGPDHIQKVYCDTVNVKQYSFIGKENSSVPTEPR